MRQHILSVSLTTALLAASGWAAGLHADEPARGAEAITAAAIAGPETRAEAAEAVDAATAASLIGAITTRFSEPDVGVKLDRMAMDPASVRDRTITGEGRVRIGHSGQWIPFRFQALYDTQTTEVFSPVLELGPDRTHYEAVAADSEVARALDAQVADALGDEFPMQPVHWNTDQVRVAPVGGSLVKVQASGTADFASEGLTGARVDALYDSDSREWLTLEYELGASANVVEETAQPEAVATR